MSHDDEINFWVERVVRYTGLYDKTLDPLRENLSPNFFIRYYDEGVAQWAEEGRKNPHIVFPPNDQQAQDIFYCIIDNICGTLDTVREDDWRSLVRISLASQAGLFAITTPGNQFPLGSKLFQEIMRCAVPKMQAINKELIAARKGREATQWLQAQNTL